VLSCKAGVGHYILRRGGIPACDSVGERSFIGLLTWIPNNVDFISSRCVDVVNLLVSKLVVLEIAPVDRAMSGLLVIFCLRVCGFVMSFDAYPSLVCTVGMVLVVSCAMESSSFSSSFIA
jgi:hypothetical protein